jgi:hypothetical protein
MTGNVARTILRLMLLVALATPAGAQSLQVFGYAGVLGEWELTASVTGNDDSKDYSGPLTMTHVGICTADGPEEKKGNIRLQVATIVAHVGDVGARRCNVHVRRPPVGFLHRLNELPGPKPGSSAHLA